MGPDAVQVQILPCQVDADANKQQRQRKSPFSRGFANYEDEFYSVDLPVLSIHGNHDGALDMGLLEA
jgi:DNA repair exonuclease SbcCD nuclease subunit